MPACMRFALRPDMPHVGRVSTGTSEVRHFSMESAAVLARVCLLGSSVCPVAYSDVVAEF
eukprot:31146-Chlamydomonas_euryale.AAC.4